MLADLSLRRGVAVLLTALCLLIAGIWVGTKVTTDYLLYKNATSTARNWARLLAETVPDLEQIAAGEKPSRASMTLFEWAQKAVRYSDTKSITLKAIRSLRQTTE